MSTLTHRSSSLADARPEGAVSRLLVTRRDPSTSSYCSLGLLTHRAGRYEFRYLSEAVESSDFLPLPGLSQPLRRYSSEHLFPVFASRVMSANRPDRARSLDAVGLGPEAEPFEILSRTGGRRVGDEVELIPLPQPDNGTVEVRFLVHGIRHRPEEDRAVIDTLGREEELQLVPEPINEHDPTAVRVETRAGVHLGYVPMPLSEAITRSLVRGRSFGTVVDCRNGPEVGFHLRLLVRFRAENVGECWDVADWRFAA